MNHGIKCLETQQIKSHAWLSEYGRVYNCCGACQLSLKHNTHSFEVVTLKVVEFGVIVPSLSVFIFFNSVISSISVLPQAAAPRLGQAASSAIRNGRNWQNRLRLTPLCSLKQSKGGSQRRGRKRWGGQKGRRGRDTRRRPPGTALNPRTWDFSFAVTWRGHVSAQSVVPRFGRSPGNAVPV